MAFIAPLTGGTSSEVFMNHRVLKRHSVFRSRAPLGRVKASALLRSESSKALQAGVDEPRSFAFVPANAKLEVLSWPKL